MIFRSFYHTHTSEVNAKDMESWSGKEINYWIEKLVKDRKQRKAIGGNWTENCFSFDVGS